MPIKASDVRKAEAAGGAHSELLPGASGPQTATYHNPRTGQEFSGLPTDPWSLERYMKVHRLLPGRAPAALRAEWEETKKTLADPTDEYRDAAAEIVRGFEDQKQANNDLLLSLVERLTQQVADLTTRLDGRPAEPPARPAPVEEKQLGMGL